MADFEQFLQVIELPVDVATNLLLTKERQDYRNGRMDHANVVFLQKQLFRLVADLLHLQLANQHTGTQLHT